MKKRLISLFLLIICGWACFLINCGLFDSDDDDDGSHHDTDITSFSSAVPAWSPDGQWIAIARMLGENWIPCGIYLVRPDGSDLHRIFSFGDGIIIIDICWAPDGEWLAFNAYQEIWKIKPNGDSLTRLTFSSENYTCTWSLSDTLIAFRHSSGDYYSGVWLMDIDGNNSRHFIRLGGHIDFAQGDSLFYEISIGQGVGQMALINTSDSTERVFYTMIAGNPYHAYYDPEISPNGLYVIMSIDEHIRKLTTEGTNLQTLTTKKGEFPHWSPDGNQIVYCEQGDNPHGGVIRIMNSDGTNNHVIVDWHELKPDSLK